MNIQEAGRKAWQTYRDAQWRAALGVSVRAYDKLTMALWLASVCVVSSSLPALTGPVGTNATVLGLVMAWLIQTPVMWMLWRLMMSHSEHAIHAMRERALRLEELGLVCPQDSKILVNRDGAHTSISLDVGALALSWSPDRVSFSLTAESEVLNPLRPRLESQRSPLWTLSDINLTQDKLAWRLNPTTAVDGWKASALAAALRWVDPTLDPLASDEVRRVIPTSLTTPSTPEPVPAGAVFYLTGCSAMLCAWLGLMIAHLIYIRTPALAIGGHGDEFTMMALAGVTLILGIMTHNARPHRQTFKRLWSPPPTFTGRKEAISFDAEGLRLTAPGQHHHMRWGDGIHVELYQWSSQAEGVQARMVLRSKKRAVEVEATLPEALVPPKAARMERSARAVIISGAAWLDLLTTVKAVNGGLTPR